MYEQDQVKFYKAVYPKGTRVKVIQMGDDEPRPIPNGTKGTVDVVDDVGTVHCTFDNGRRLGLIPNIDIFTKVWEE